MSGSYDSANRLRTYSGFKPSSYNTELTMDGTAQSVALATGVKLGNGKVRIVNKGVTTEAIRVAFGSTAASAEAGLTIASAAATTGLWIGSAADGYAAEVILDVPATASYIAVANAVASDTQTVELTQGV